MNLFISLQKSSRIFPRGILAGCDKTNQLVESLGYFDKHDDIIPHYKFSLGRTDPFHNYTFVSYLLSSNSRTSEERVTVLLSNSHEARFINPQTLFIASCSRSERNGYFTVLRTLPIVFRYRPPCSPIFVMHSIYPNIPADSIENVNVKL